MQSFTLSHYILAALPCKGHPLFPNLEMLFIHVKKQTLRREKGAGRQTGGPGEHRADAGAETQELHGARREAGGTRGRAQEGVRQAPRTLHRAVQDPRGLHGEDEAPALRPAVGQRAGGGGKAELQQDKHGTQLGAHLVRIRLPGER